MPHADSDALGAELVACVERYERTRDVRELDRAIALGRLVGRSRVALGNLASMLLGRYEARRARADLEECMSILDTLARTGPVTVLQVAMVARTALHVYKSDGDPAELERAIDAARFGLAATSSEHSVSPAQPAPPELHAALASALHTRFDLTGRTTDLAEAVEAYRAAADADTGLRRLGHLVNVVRQSRRWLVDLALPWQSALAAGAIAAADEVAAHLPERDPLRGEMVQEAGVLLRHRYEATGDPADLQESLRRLRQAVSLPVDEATHRRSRLVSLGAALHRAFQATGDHALLTEAIECCRRALAVTPVGDPERPGQLNNLAAALRERTLHLGDFDALREAIGLLREAVDLAPDDRGRGLLLNTLGVALQDQFRRTWDPAVADEAVACAREAVALDVGRGEQRLALGNALTKRYLARGHAADLAEALTVLEDLLARSNEALFVRSRCLHALGRVWRLEFDRTGDLGALDRAITAAGRATRADPLDDADRAEYRRFFAELLLVQHERVGALGPLRAARDTFAAAATDAANGPLDRVHAARQWADVAVRLGEWPTALDAARVAMSLLPEVASRRLAWPDRERGVAELSGVAADAAALAVQAGDAGLAVRWLEQGRGVLLGQLLDARSEVADLRRRHPRLAARLADVDEALAALDVAVAGSDRRHAVARRREELLAEIRSLPGFGEFLLPPSLARVQEWAGEGPVVLINVSRYRCDALVLGSGPLVAIPLPALTFDDAVRHADRFADALEASTTFGREHQGGRVITDVLEWLDETVTGPVLRRLACDGARVWWSPGGPLAGLPLHAAGRPGDGVLERVISSYTPTVRALGHARDTASRAVGPTDVLTVAVAEPDAAPPLPHTDEEAAAIGELWAGTVLTGADATADRVLDALARHSWVHFACHGAHDADDPSASRLLLHDRPLTVLEVSRAHLPDARLAVLSACHTARGALHLADEALHLAGAFQIAGYPGVVATLWHVNDTMARRIAVAFHTALAAAGGPRAPGHAAAVLRDVLLRFRDYPPSLWAGWVHSGI